MFEIILASFLIILASLSGKVTIWKRANHIIVENMGFLISFSAGVFILITYGLITETIHHAENLKIGILWIVIGFFGIWLLFKLLPISHHHDNSEKCNHCDQCEECHNENHNKIDARRILLGDGLHNVGDGVLLATAFMVNSWWGFLTAISIFIHELVQETSQFFILRHSGYSVHKALKWNLIVSATILIGAIGGFFALENFEILEMPLLGLSGGAFLIIIAQDLIPHSIRELKKEEKWIKHSFKHLIWFLVGFLIMFGVNLITEKYHAHDYSENQQEQTSVQV